MTNPLKENHQNISVLELRNYFLKPNSTDTFSSYFNKYFVNPMNELGGYTLGQFKIGGVNDRFVWFRGFTDMNARVKFLNDFYINSPTWKKFGSGANDMMLNSDNVYLLRPLNNKIINSKILKTDKGITVVDFYICNSTLDKVINLFETTYIPFLKTLSVEDISLWLVKCQKMIFHSYPFFRIKTF